jgi:predicted deacylase
MSYLLSGDKGAGWLERVGGRGRGTYGPSVMSHAMDVLRFLGMGEGRARRCVLVILAASLASALLVSCAAGRAEPDLSAGLSRWETIGRSFQDRPIEAKSIGKGEFRVLIVGGIHGNEAEPAACIDAVCKAIRDARANASVRVVRDVNPDGSVARSRGNARGVDLNRNWPASNFRPSAAHGAAALSEPESRLLHGEILRFRPDVILVFHSIASGPFVNYDGPALHLANRFSEAAQRADPRWHVRPSMGYQTFGSLGSWAGVDRGIPILTIELERGHERGLAAASLIEGVVAVLSAGSNAPHRD